MTVDHCLLATVTVEADSLMPTYQYKHTHRHTHTHTNTRTHRHIHTHIQQLSTSEYNSFHDILKAAAAGQQEAGAAEYIIHSYIVH